jgi:hypothetical protein
VVASALVAVACVLASARRLALAVQPTWLDARLLAKALEREPSVRGDADRIVEETSWAKLRNAIAACDRAIWENELIAALETADERTRIALVNEQLRELDWRAQRWARVPRVCASVATSAGFLFACVAVLRGLAVPTEETNAVLISAVDALAVGIAGTSFCAAVHGRARRIASERLAATDRLVEHLEGFFRSPVDL